MQYFPRHVPQLQAKPGKQLEFVCSSCLRTDLQLVSAMARFQPKIGSSLSCRQENLPEHPINQTVMNNWDKGVELM